MKHIRSLLAGGALAFAIAIAPLMAAPLQQTANGPLPQSVQALTDTASMKVFSDTQESGIRVHNQTDKPVTIEDPLTFTSVTLAPGDSIGLSCDSSRQLAITFGNSITLDTFARGTVLRFTLDKEVK